MLLQGAAACSRGNAGLASVGGRAKSVGIKCMSYSVDSHTNQSIIYTCLICRMYCTVGASSSVTRRVLAEIIYVIYYEVWAVFILEYKLKGQGVNE